MQAITRARKNIIIGAAVVLGLLFMAGAQEASASHSWGGYHWARTANPLKISLGDNVGSAWDSYLQTASTDWSQSLVIDTAIVPTKSNKPRTCRAVAGRVEVCNALYGSTGWLGIATVWASGSHITQATVRLNDTYYRTAKYNTPAWKQFVVCQEIGHTFGLAHQDESFSNANLGSCMDYTNLPDTNQHPNSHDYAQLESIYAHLDTSNTTTQQKASAPAATDTDPSSWGRAARSERPERPGRESVFENTLQNGDKVFTFVVWADDAGHEDHDH
ncbi:MAG TPA: hypothetical protein VJJ20_01050 [Candidatus Paceibacterota bacterium]